MAQNLDFKKLLPNYLKNETLTSLIDNLFNRFVSQESSVFVAGTVGLPQQGQSEIQQPTLERQENDVVPGLYFAAGKEQSVFTFEDFINKMEVLDIDQSNLRSWMAEQTYNYSPPINYDKFINYANYYWIGKFAPTNVMSWNPDNEREYYVIQQPKPTDTLSKMPVRLATTRNINRWINDRPQEKITVTFTSANTFNVSSDIDTLVRAKDNVGQPFFPISTTPNESTRVVIESRNAVLAPSISNPDLLPADFYDVMEFYIVNGNVAFSAGDTIEIELLHYTSQSTVAVNAVSLIGKGTATGASTLSPFMFIDGIQLKVGDRVLLVDQDDNTENGIYIVSSGGEWARSFDATLNGHFTIGQKIFVEEGTQYGGWTFEVIGKTPGQDAFAPISAGLDFAGAPGNESGVNQWQLYNYWVHRDDLPLYATLGIDLNNVLQAQRPIIEYSNQLKMNAAINSVTGEPCDASHIDAVPYDQEKTRFNQLPQFDLYRYDGTHAGKTSGIWFYKENALYETDPVLLRRVETTVNTDFVFELGLKDEDGRLLYFSQNGKLESIWQPGVTAAAATSNTFVGTVGVRTTQLRRLNIKQTADTQDWTVTLISPSVATVVGSRSGYVGNVTVGPFAGPATSFDDFDLILAESSFGIPFVAGDKFTFSILNKIIPRYIKEDDADNIINYPAGSFDSGFDADMALPEPVGAWLTPLRMFQNMNRETRDTVAFADFLNHARSVLRNQSGFSGSSFGNNNSRNIGFNPGYGGRIREFGSNFPLLSSMLIQPDISPISIIDFAEQQYNVALSSIDQFILTELAGWLSNGGTVPSALIDPNDPNVVALAAYYESIRGLDSNLTAMFGDSTSMVKNWPATLPMLGLIEPTLPQIILDEELNQYVIVHHDGHYSPVALADPLFNQQLTQTVVARSDGTSSPGVFFNLLPPSFRPYANQLWMVPATGQLFMFDVEFDSEDQPASPADGDLWYQRSTNTLFEWDVSTFSWVDTGNPESAWALFSPENIRNSLILNIENKLYESVHVSQQINVDIVAQNALPQAERFKEVELARFAAKYGYDTFAPDYDATNAFTWNYSQATIPGVTTAARWFDVNREYFAAFGVGDLSRPDIYPWRLGTAGFPAAIDKPAGWDAAYESTVVAASTTTPVRLIARAPIAWPFTLTGLPVIDGVQTVNGDRILVQGQSNEAQNGIFIASSAGWTRAADVFLEGMTVEITEGASYAGTLWVVTSPDPIIVNTSAIVFEQVRTWKEQMWADIKAANPGIKLSVNTVTDALLAPYVDPSLPESSEALLTVIPVGVDSAYTYQQNGPVENVWTKSIEYLYGLARTAFRISPLEFLDDTWGETYLKNTDNLRVERNLQTSLPHKQFLLHGERLQLTNEFTPLEVRDRLLNVTNGVTWTSDFQGTVDFKVTHCASTGQLGPGSTNLGPSATVFGVFVNGTLETHVFEGVPFSFSAQGVTYTNVTIEDFGVAFEMGDTLTMTFKKDEIIESIPTDNTDFIYGILGCEGCVADATPDPTIIIEVIEFQPTYSFTSGQAKVLKGLGQWFTNLLRYSYIDTDMSTAALAFRGWDMKLVHRFGALIRPDSLTVRNSAGVIPDTGYDVILKRSTQTENLWISGLRIQLVQMGAQRKLNASGRLIPIGTGDDWVFRIETYNPAHPIADYNVLDTSGDFTTFDALMKQNTDVAWKRYTTKTGTATATMPLQITGVQNVLNFLFGYVGQLEELNFKINETDMPLTDAVTGRNLDWQLEIEKFINTVYSGMDAGDAAILNPFMDKLYLQTPNGLMGRFTASKFLDAYSTQAAYDVTGAVIPVENLSVVRRDDQTITYSKTPIFSAHLFVDQFEHALLMNERISDDDTSVVIFDQFLGQYLSSAYLSFYRQERINNKPTFDGYVLSGNDIKRNITSSIDAVQNAYDVTSTFAEPKMAEHALALVGFQQKDYFDDIDVSPKAQLDFWRGMISAKGTTLAINAFTQYKAFAKASVDEFWAYKLAEYGDARERTMPEIKINPNDCFRQFTSLQFYSKDDVSYTALPLFTQIEAGDDDRWFSIGDLGTTLRFDANAISEIVSVSAPGYVVLANVYHNGDTMGPSISPAVGARVVNATTIYVDVPGTYIVSGFTWNNQAKLSPVKLFDYSASELEQEIGLWHPAIGVHSYKALELVNITASSDPANYNYSTQTTNNPNFMTLKPWDEREVGRVWWDTSKLAYVPYYDASIFPNRESRNSRWGSLAEWASVDLYEWTESIYHPSQYDAIARVQEGDSSIDAKIRLSGRVGFKNFYSANRSVSARAIAWSQAGVANGAAHPAFGLAADKTVYKSNNQLIVDEGRLEDVQLTAGRRFGGWDILNSAPVGEVIIGSNVGFVIGASIPPTDVLNDNYLNTQFVVIPPAAGGISFSKIEVVKMPSSSMFGTRIGQITVSAYSVNTTDVDEPVIWFLRMADSTDFFEDVRIQNWISSRLVVGDTKNIDFETFGLRVAVTATASGGSITADILAQAPANPLNDIFVREGVNYVEVMPLTDVAFSNREIFGAAPSSLPEYGWKAWDVPTAAQLRSDLPAPRNKWRPYLGAPQTISNVTADVIAEMQNVNNTWTLANGITINRYTSTWSDWVEMRDVRQTAISNGVDQIVFTIDLGDEDSIDANRLSVYANGVQTAPNQIVISSNTVQVVNTLPEGTNVYLLYRAYQPTAAELEFNPEVKDDFKTLVWYKADYQYTKLDVRDRSGNIAAAKYYFWVKDKTIPQDGKSMSLAQATQLLRNGDSTFMIFSRMLPDSNAQSGAAFDSCAISGLGTTVTKNDSYKLRFLRDFTLRDDPEELKLKNTHTEWALIRERQTTKLPRTLWDALTNAVCGQDAAGNSLPSATRINYDEKHGTRTRYGFETGQIFVESDLAIKTIVNTILNTSLTIDIGSQTIVDYITFMNINSSTTEESLIADWFADATMTRNTMNQIFGTARASQINEIFFAVLNDALADNYEFTDLFKTSLITVNSATVIQPQVQLEQQNEFY